MAKSLKSRCGRVVAGMVLVGAILGLVFVIRSATELDSWASAEGTAQEWLKSGKSISLKVEYPLPDGTKHVEPLSENGSAHQPGERMTVRYDLENGRVVDSALADTDPGALGARRHAGLRDPRRDLREPDRLGAATGVIWGGSCPLSTVRAEICIHTG